MAMFETFGGAVTQPSFPGGAELILSENTQLAWPIQFQNTLDVVYNYIDVLPTGNGFTLTLPDATLASSFQSVIINNPTAFTFALNKFDGSLLLSFTPGISRYIILIDNTTQAGTWRTFPFAAGGSSVTSINMTSSSNNVVIGGVPITSAGTITLALANDLLQLSTKGTSTGVACRTATNTWNLRDVVGTANQIAITNPRGIAGDITIALEADVVIDTSLTVGQLYLSEGTIATLTPSFPLTLAPDSALVVVEGIGLAIKDGNPLIFFADNGVNYTSFEGGAQSVNVSLIWPTVAPTPSQVLGYFGGNQLEWFNVSPFSGSSTVNALAKYLNTTGTLQDSGVILDATNNMTGIRSATIGHIRIGDPAGILNTTIVTTGVNESIFLEPNGSGHTETTGDFYITTGKKLSFYNAGNTQYIALSSPGALGASSEFLFPTLAPAKSTLFLTDSSTSPYTWANAFLTSKQNILYNGAMNVWQRMTSFTNATFIVNNDNTYTADAWKLLSGANNTVNVTQEAGPTALVAAYARYCLRMTVVTTGQKFGICQIREAIESVPLRGNTVILQITALGTGAGTTAKMAVIGWNGAANSPTSDPVSNWNGTGVDPTLAANWSYQGATISLALTGNFAVYYSNPITIANDVNNIGVLIWCDSTATNVNDQLNLTCIALTKNFEYTPFSPEDPETEWGRCKRIFQKDFNYATPVGSVTTVSTRGTYIVSVVNAATNIPNNANYATVFFEQEMTDAKANVVTIYPFTTVTNTNIVSNQAGTDLAANTGTVNAAYNMKKGFVLQNTSGGVLNATGFIYFHYMADAGF